MINLAAAAVLVRDLTEQHLEGTDGSAPAERNRQAPFNGSAPAGRSRQAPPNRSAPAGRSRQTPQANGDRPARGATPGGAPRRMPRSA